MQLYAEEISLYEKRLAIMEEAELQRMHKEMEKKEELANNHGQKPGFFMMPILRTKSRYDQKIVKDLSTSA